MKTDHTLTLTVEQAAEVLGIGRSTAYELVRSGDLKHIRLRRRVVVPVAHLAERLGVDRNAVWNALGVEVASLPSPTSDVPSKRSSARRRSTSAVETPSLF